MCYNSCEFFKFNPLTGEDKCTMTSSDICPDSTPVSNCCNAEMNFWPESDLCPKCLEHCEAVNQ